MNIKKILALTVIVLALFSCMSAASAGLFDFFGGESNQTYTFNGFTLDIPESAEVSTFNLSRTNSEGYVENYHYTITMENGETVNVSSAEGAGIATSIDIYVANLVSGGADLGGTYGDWTIIKTNNIPLSAGDGSIKVNPDYILVKFSGAKIITISGNNLDQLKNIADTYKEV